MHNSPASPSVEVAAVVVANGDVGRRQRQADRAGEVLDGERIGDRGGRGLGQSVGFDQRLAGQGFPPLGDHALHRHAAADRQMQAREIEPGEILVVEQRVEQGVDAGDDRARRLSQRLDEGRDVARIGDQEIGCADHHRDEAVRLKGEHMVERQRRQERFALGTDRGGDPGVHLLQIGDQVAMGQHRPLRHAGRPAGVLQERDVRRLDRRFRERLRSPKRERAIEALRLLEAIGGNRAPDVAQDKIDDPPARAAQLIAGAGDHDRPDRRAADRLLEHAGEVLQDHDRFRARIGELMA